jgi:hypothetical protein
VVCDVVRNTAIDGRDAPDGSGSSKSTILEFDHSRERPALLRLFGSFTFRPVPLHAEVGRFFGRSNCLEVLQ